MAPDACSVVVLRQTGQVCGSPIPSFVHVNPEQILTLGKPKETSIAEVAPIKCYDNLIYVTTVGTEIIVLETKDLYLLQGID